jgi:predicted AAA+ superfamily ATPase
MDDDVLGKVVEVEKEVQQRLEIEKKMSREWLENVKKDAEEKIIAEEKELKGAASDAVRKEKIIAEKKAAEIVNKAKAEGKILEEIKDDILKTIIRNHIVRILPGQ